MILANQIPKQECCELSDFPVRVDTINTPSGPPLNSYNTKHKKARTTYLHTRFLPFPLLLNSSTTRRTR